MNFLLRPEKSLWVITLLLLVSLACAGIATPVPTLDSDAIQTAIAGTLAAQAPISTATNTLVPTDTLLPSNTPADIETQLSTSTPEALSIPATGPTAAGASCIPNNPPQTGKVVDVVDGDTIKVQLDQDGQTYTVRYIGMDTPESTTQIEFFGAEAAVKNVQLVFGKTATLIKDVSETDRFGRLLRYVIVDDLFINYELVAQGYANTASYPPDVACISTFQDAERRARASNLGLWNAPPTLAAHPTLAPAPSGGGGANAPCNCGGPDLDCKDFSTHADAQECHDYCMSQGFGDVFRLDGDSDGLACESLP